MATFRDPNGAGRSVFFPWKNKWVTFDHPTTGLYATEDPEEIEALDANPNIVRLGSDEAAEEPTLVVERKPVDGAVDGTEKTVLTVTPKKRRPGRPRKAKKGK